MDQKNFSKTFYFVPDFDWKNPGIFGKMRPNSTHRCEVLNNSKEQWTTIKFYRA